MDNKHDILALLRGVAVAEGTVSPENALLKLKEAPFEDLGYAKVDLHRPVRQGAAEVIYGAGKTPEQIAGIAAKLGERGCQNILVTRMGPEAAEEVAKTVPLDYHPEARLGIAFPGQRNSLGNIVVATGGTSDIPVAEDHRLLGNLDTLMSARCVVAVAGMEGALASVIGGLVDCPVIAVPTSVGYGASFGGLSALLSMLNSCASGCSVVNIDNGFGAGFLASRINQMEGLEEH